MLLPASGCVSASLASNTGPRLTGDVWSVAPEQQVHVGETVRFDFVLVDAFGQLVHPAGLADYCVAEIEGERLEIEPGSGGHFQFEHTFTGTTPGQGVDVRATAYRQRGARDYMNVVGEWVRNVSPYELDDQRIASSWLRLVAYQALIDLSLVCPADELEPDTGVLSIRRRDGSGSSIYVDRSGRRGFTLDGPSPEGYYRIRYAPRGEELESTGATEVEFSAHDLAGRKHSVRAELPTP